jgi:F-box protein 9
MKDLIASFAGLSIEPVPPEIEGMPQPPCPIASLPTEILVHILRDVAILDIGDFVRLSQVCKRFAYLVATENRIWRRICLGTEFGFGGMHYYWQRQITWDPLTEADLLREAEEAAAAAAAEAEAATDAEDSTTTTSALPPPAFELSLSARAQRHAEESAANTLAFYRALYSSSWQRMFRFRPRVRFNGCYICTVNYIRAGQASPHTTTWNTPVHIVTYYRYLRFFRDGTCISLLTTAEPADVVHHLTREAVTSGVASNNAASLSALKGRWRLARESDNPGASISEVEGDLMIETEGVAKYIYRLDLAFKTAGRAAKNNKLVWKGFYSYNTLTGDWAEFTLRDNTPFFFSRVKSYGVRGE